MKCTDCNRPVRPVVAVDIDGTIGDYHNHFRSFAEQYLDKRIDPSWGREYGYEMEFNEHLGIDKETYRQVKLAYRQGGLKRMMPVFRHYDALFSVLRNENVEVWITTTRPWQRFDSTDPDTRHWLDRHHISYEGLIFDDDKYSRLAEVVGRERIVAVVDDLPEQCKRAHELGISYLQVVRGHSSTAIMPSHALGLGRAVVAIQNSVIEWRKANTDKERT